MKKLVLKVQKDKDAKLLLTAAFALTQYKKTRPATRGDYNDYNALEDYCLEPEDVTAEHPENWRQGIKEYEVDAGLIDFHVLETLDELQKLIPFEMYFESRGRYGYEEREYYDKYGRFDFEIHDDAIAGLFYAEPAIYPTANEIAKWRAKEKAARTVQQLPIQYTKSAKSKAARKF